MHINHVSWVTKDVRYIEAAGTTNEGTNTVDVTSNVSPVELSVTYECTEG